MDSPYPYSAVLFDMDGTILDSEPGIAASITYAVTEIGRPVPSASHLRSWLGPPLPESFAANLGLQDRELRYALDLFKRHYVSRGIFQSKVYRGMSEVLRHVRDSGLASSTATSKVESQALLILEHFRMASLVDIVVGASEDESRSAKALVVEDALRRLDARGADISRPVLIGDRRHDVQGGLANGVPTIIAAWGYGDTNEYEGAVAIAKSPSDLIGLLGV